VSECGAEFKAKVEAAKTTTLKWNCAKEMKEKNKTIIGKCMCARKQIA